MSQLPFSLREADARRVGGCLKPACKAWGTVHRHHRRHEAMWLGIWSGRRRHEAAFQSMVKRYHEFRIEDCEILCPNHHAEIHKIYDGIISADRKKTGRPLSKYSWVQANLLMDKLEAACLRWLKTQSPGIDSKYYGDTGKRKPPKPER